MKLRFVVALILLSAFSYAQNSAVSATIIDPDGQAWNNGKYTITFVPTPGVPGPYIWNGVANFPQNYTGSFSNTGLLTVTIPDNSFVKPLGSKWQFTLCSNTSAPCQNIVLSVAGAAPDLSSALSTPLIAPRFGAGQFAFGYLDAEVAGMLLPGSFYFNVTNLIQRVWTGSAWTNGGGSGLLTGSGVNGSYTAWTGPFALNVAPATFSGNNSSFSGAVSAGPGAPSGCGVGATGCLAASEAATAGTPVAGVDYIRADSVTHTLRCSQNGGAEAPCLGSGGGLPASPQKGDSIRFNVYGDSLWDATQSGFHNGATLYQAPNTSTPNNYGAVGNTTAGTLGTSSVLYPSSGESGGRSYTPAATSSTSTVVGETLGQAPNFGIYGMSSWYRWSFRFTPGATASLRWWMGVTVFDTGGTGTDITQPVGTTRFATDVPNCHVLGFRFSSGTDTNWMAIGNTGNGGAQTATSTGVAPDTTNPHTFEITYDGSTTAKFYIDGSLKVTMTTNLPSNLRGAEGFWSGDNENTNTAANATSYWMSLELH